MHFLFLLYPVLFVEGHTIPLLYHKTTNHNFYLTKNTIIFSERKTRFVEQQQ